MVGVNRAVELVVRARRRGAFAADLARMLPLGVIATRQRFRVDVHAYVLVGFSFFLEIPISKLATNPGLGFDCGDHGDSG